ncbi:MAG: hypothetical protein E7404_00010 [Ruminococcaceae bacterium]|nr:hypothetical protein [Oscillospiraceae bacterium]
MKVMTINTHSYIEKNSEKKLDIFVDAINRIKPDIIAMQEVNQSKDELLLKKNEHITECGIGIKTNNFAYRVLVKLNNMGNNYHLVWLGIKRGFEVFDEGLCFLSKVPIKKHKEILLSRTDDINNWKKRMALGININDEWFYNVHFGRWDDKEESFYDQWRTFEKNISQNEKVWVMGDFNSPSDIKNEGYDLVLSGDFYDTYYLAKNKDEGYTVRGKIDGWDDKDIKKSRIDYIFTNEKYDIKSSYTIFNGKNEEIISDHFGIIIDFERE